MTILLSKSGAYSDLINVKNPTYGATGDGTTDDTTALQNAINAAVAAGKPLYIPVGLYKNTGLTVGGNLTIIGAGVSGAWTTASINVPTGAQPIVGAVLYTASNGSHAISLTSPSISLNIRNIGILFQTPFSGTGDGIRYIPSTATNPGLTDFEWDNVIVYGHDGDHYAANLQNPILGTMSRFSSYGGGALKANGNSSSLNFGNITVEQLYGQVLVGGTANGVTLSASAAQRLNLIEFIRPQIIVNNQSGVSPGGNPPTSAQYIWSEDSNVTNITKTGADFETNVSSKLQLSPPTNGNPFDWPSLFTNAASIESPTWGVYGRMFNGQGQAARNFKDTTASGATGDTAMFLFPASNISASSAATYSVLATVYVTPPVVGTNVTATKLRAIYATGAIETTSSLSGQNLTASGTSALLGNVGLAKSSITTACAAVAAGTTAKSQINLAVGVAPTSSNDGDVWYESGALKMNQGGVVKTFTLV